MKEKLNNKDFELIAPCGIYCGVCGGYLAYLKKVPKQRGKINYCTGCRPRNKQCAFLKKRCEKLITNKITFCFECSEFPCRRLKHIDERYRKDFNVSLIENLQIIKTKGIKTFLDVQKNKYKCSKCGGLICVHNRFCYDCEIDLLNDYIKRENSSIRKVN